MWPIPPSDRFSEVNRRRLAVLLVYGVGWAAVTMTGCSPSGPDVQMVKGVVLLEGHPLDGATVGFSPVNPEIGLPASGVTAADGSFRLTATRGGRTGAGTTVGEYVVTVNKSHVEALTPPSEDDPNYGRGPSRFPDITPIVEPVFGDVTRSPLRATVTTGQNSGDAFRFEVTRPAKEN